jgi:DNA-binding transcriptional ArsR family regulator/uncharacterized protein YndB with AHSA1/START domain
VTADDDAALGLLGDPTRRLIFTLLGQAPCSVTELAAQLPVTRPAISQHLTLLKSCGLLRSQARGTRRIYKVDPERASALIDHLHRTAFPWPPTRHRPLSPRDAVPGAAGGAALPVRSSTTVPARRERAFAAFTAGLRTWWPPGFHLGATEPVDFCLEPWAGGGWFERAADGSRCDWGRITTWDRPRRLVASWEIDGHWERDPDPAHAGEVAVRFRSSGPDQTVVHVEHRGFDRLVGGSELRQAFAAGVTWDLLLARFATSITAGPSLAGAADVAVDTAKGRPTR